MKPPFVLALMLTAACAPQPAASPAASPAVSPVASPPTDAQAAYYTCPMHPEVVRHEPGACPICGMALEPRHVGADAGNPELEDMTRRFRWSAMLTAGAFKFRVGVNNLTNEKYFTKRTDEYPGPGIIPSATRTWYVGVGWGIGR